MRNLDFEWQKNKEWYYRDEELDYCLTDKAPEEARRHFEIFMNQCKVPEDLKN